MNNWIECKIKYEKTASDGKINNVTETYLVDALSFTEAEARISEEMKSLLNSDFKIISVKRARLNEVFPSVYGGIWYRCKVFYVSIDEETGYEKKTGVFMLVQADSLENAVENLKEGMKGTLADWELSAVSETNILDLFVYAVD